MVNKFNVIRQKSLLLNVAILFFFFFLFLAIAVRLYVGGKNQKKGSAPGKQGALKKGFAGVVAGQQAAVPADGPGLSPPSPIQCHGGGAGTSPCITPQCLVGPRGGDGNMEVMSYMAVTSNMAVTSKMAVTSNMATMSNMADMSNMAVTSNMAAISNMAARPAAPQQGPCVWWLRTTSVRSQWGCAEEKSCFPPNVCHQGHSKAKGETKHDLVEQDGKWR